MADLITSWSTLALALSSFAAVAIAYWGIKKQTESLAKSVSADLCLKLVDRFESSQMIEIRGAAAEALLKGTNLTRADDVFDFFEMLGLYIRRGLLDTEILHSMFFHWINLYWLAGKPYILKSRDRSTDIYRDFESLYRVVLSVEKEVAPKSRDINPTKEDLDKLLTEELI